jgi:D-alanyl-D-alanine carboxypeptidase/D-alanyl-D-alanine-endopeptidase (penicillin-binding protein 4)
MSELASLCLKPSDNLIAHQLWLHVGADVRRRPRNGEAPGRGDDSERASAALGRFLAGLGISANEVTLEEGSGLSRKNLVTPSATVRLLRSMVNHPAGAAYRAALPVGGVDGTLKGRFTQPGLRGNVVAKTGTLRHVNALGGYLTTAGGQPLAFAIYVNGFQSADPSASGRAEMDRMVELLARFAGRGPE